MARIADIIAVDPGDNWTGVAFFTYDDAKQRWTVEVQEFNPDDFNDAWMETLVAREEPAVLIIEKFRLYEDKSVEQTGSEFLTAQQIGVLKFITRKHNEHAQAHLDATWNTGLMTTCERPGGVCNNPDLPMPSRVDLIIQPADIKKPTAGILRHKGIKSVAKGLGAKHFASGKTTHCADAELHGWHYIFKQERADADR